MAQPFNVSFRKVGGIRFLKVGRLTASFSISAQSRPVYTARPVVERNGPHFAQHLRSTNPNFNADRSLAACLDGEV